MTKDEVLAKIAEAENGEWVAENGLCFSLNQGTVYIKENGLVAFLIDSQTDFSKVFLSSGGKIGELSLFVQFAQKIGRMFGFAVEVEGLPPVHNAEGVPEVEAKSNADTAFDPDKEFFRGKWAALNEILTDRKVTLE